MNILVIGHEGYLGRGLFDYFKRRHKVWGWDKKEDLFNLGFKFLADNNIEAVVNLSVAADRQGKNFVIDAPGDRVNVQGARHLAEILKGTDISWFQLSTREVLGPIYGVKDVTKTKNGYRPKRLIDESYPYAPLNFYGKSKVMAEMISESHSKSNVIRLTSCYTDYDHPGGGNWMVGIIKAAVNKKPVTLTRGGRQFRDPMHVDDLGHLVELLHERKVFGEKFHAGGGRKNLISLLEFVKLADPKAKIAAMAGGDYGFAFDNKKALRLAGWAPQVLVRDKIAVIADNIRRGVMEPPPKKGVAAALRRG
jgi:nucleoside-diphosphate-sugar epimerase